MHLTLDVGNEIFGRDAFLVQGQQHGTPWRSERWLNDPAPYERCVRVVVGRSPSLRGRVVGGSLFFDRDLRHGAAAIAVRIKSLISVDITIQSDIDTVLSELTGRILAA
jgi:hypothetical protein